MLSTVEFRILRGLREGTASLADTASSAGYFSGFSGFWVLVSSELLGVWLISLELVHWFMLRLPKTELRHSWAPVTESMLDYLCTSCSSEGHNVCNVLCTWGGVSGRFVWHQNIQTVGGCLERHIPQA